MGTRADRIALALVLVVTAVGIVALPRLSATVAVHFAPGGTPGTYVPRREGVFSLPVVMVVLILVVRGAARLDPPTDPRSVDAIVLGTTGLLGVVYLFVLGWNMGYPLAPTLLAPLVCLSTLVIVGYVVVRETASSPDP